MKTGQWIAGLGALVGVQGALWAQGPIGFSVSDGNSNLYQINMLTGVATSLGALDYPENDELEGLASVGGILLGVGEADLAGGGGVYNITTPPGFRIGQTSARFGNEAGAAVNPLTGILYNVGSNDVRPGAIGTFLYQTSYVTGVSTFIGATLGENVYVDGLAINSAGEAFATDFRLTDSLYRVNLATGALSLVGSLGLGDVNFDSGLAFDVDGSLYAMREDGVIYTLNTTTGAATFQAFVTDSVTGQRVQGDLEGLDIPALTLNTQVIPEPSTALLLGLGFVGVLAGVRRRRTARP